jgi:glyceraldehyde 3-phosphate dehydrogenase
MIGINGLGRIGRLAARQLAREGLLAGLNDPAELGTLVHLLRRDSIHHHAPLEAEGQAAEAREELLLEGRRIPLFHAADPGRIPWDSAGVRLVVESSGRFTRRADAARHLRGGVTHAVISAPSPDPDFTVMLPFNGDRLDLGAQRVLSNASCTAHATAPLLEVLHRAFGLETVSMTTVHVATNDQRLLDAPHKDLRRARAAMVGIHPTTSSAFSALKQALPWLPADFDGWALRVPTLSVNLVELTALLPRDTTVAEVHAAFAEAEAGWLKGILASTPEELVSSDFIGRTESVVLDLGLTQLQGGRLLKVSGWHDNEVGYAARLVELVRHLAARLAA